MKGGNHMTREMGMLIVATIMLLLFDILVVLLVYLANKDKYQ